MKSRHMNAAVCSSAGEKISAKLLPENRRGATTGCTRLMIKHFDTGYLTQSKIMLIICCPFYKIRLLSSST